MGFREIFRVVLCGGAQPQGQAINPLKAMSYVHAVASCKTIIRLRLRGSADEFC